MAELENQPDAPKLSPQNTEKQLDLLDAVDELRVSLKQLNPDELTPKQALDALYTLKALSRE